VNNFSPYNVNICNIQKNYSGLEYGILKIFDIILFINIDKNENIWGGGGVGGIVKD
jgi:hypothetical protein